MTQIEGGECCLEHERDAMAALGLVARKGFNIRINSSGF